MTSIAELPEIRALDSRSSLIRIPAEQDIPITPRVRRLIDTADFRRLSQVSQLGLVSLVYPGCTHTRFEHSLGVYRNALLFLRRLAADERFRQVVTARDAEILIAAALLHDLGHYPFCHAIEDLQLPGVQPHETQAAQQIDQSDVGDLLNRQWNGSCQSVIELMQGVASGRASAILMSILSGPIDIDKMDYLYRDSLHAGVPYGMHYDRQRLIGSLCVNELADGIAITEKGRTAAELMVFARYVMFSEVYWHHAVRSATAMLQRLFFAVHHQLDLSQFYQGSDLSCVQFLKQGAASSPDKSLFDCLFGPTRQLYKRVAQYSFLENADIFQLLAQRPYPWLQRCSRALAHELSSAVGSEVSESDVLIDAPPVCLEVQFKVSVCYAQSDRFRPLGEVSPVVKALAEQQFDHFVKRVRVFVHPKQRDAVCQLRNLDELVQRAVERTTADEAPLRR